MQAIFVMTLLAVTAAGFAPSVSIVCRPKVISTCECPFLDISGSYLYSKLVLLLNSFECHEVEMYRYSILFFFEAQSHNTPPPIYIASLETASIPRTKNSCD